MSHILNETLFYKCLHDLRVAREPSNVFGDKQKTAMQSFLWPSSTPVSRCTKVHALPKRCSRWCLPQGRAELCLVKPSCSQSRFDTEQDEAIMYTGKGQWSTLSNTPALCRPPLTSTLSRQLISLFMTRDSEDYNPLKTSLCFVIVFSCWIAPCVNKSKRLIPPRCDNIMRRISKPCVHYVLVPFFARWSVSSNNATWFIFFHCCWWDTFWTRHSTASTGKSNNPHQKQLSQCLHEKTWSSTRRSSLVSLLLACGQSGSLLTQEQKHNSTNEERYQVALNRSASTQHVGVREAPDWFQYIIHLPIKCQVIIKSLIYSHDGYPRLQQWSDTSIGLISQHPSSSFFLIAGTAAVRKRRVVLASSFVCGPVWVSRWNFPQVTSPSHSGPH